MALSASGSEFSPLDLIKRAEADVTRRIAAAREAEEQAVVRARTEAALLKSQAREEGRNEGQVRYREVVAKAEEEAKAISVHAKDRAQDLRRKGQRRMEAAVGWTINVIIGLEEIGEIE